MEFQKLSTSLPFAAQGKGGRVGFCQTESHSQATLLEAGPDLKVAAPSDCMVAVCPQKIGQDGGQGLWEGLNPSLLVLTQLEHETSSQKRMHFSFGKMGSVMAA